MCGVLQASSFGGTLLASDKRRLERASHRYQSVADEQAALKMRIRDLAQ